MGVAQKRVSAPCTPNVVPALAILGSTYKKEFCTLRKLDCFLMRYFLLHNWRSSAVSLIAALLVF
jgi:hypothetical protein